MAMQTIQRIDLSYIPSQQGTVYDGYPEPLDTARHAATPNGKIGESDVGEYINDLLLNRLGLNVDENGDGWASRQELQDNWSKIIERGDREVTRHCKNAFVIGAIIDRELGQNPVETSFDNAERSEDSFLDPVQERLELWAGKAFFKVMRFLFRHSE